MNGRRTSSSRSRDKSPGASKTTRDNYEIRTTRPPTKGILRSAAMTKPPWRQGRLTVRLCKLRASLSAARDWSRRTLPGPCRSGTGSGRFTMARMPRRRNSSLASASLTCRTWMRPRIYPDKQDSRIFRYLVGYHRFAEGRRDPRKIEWTPLHLRRKRTSARRRSASFTRSRIILMPGRLMPQTWRRYSMRRRIRMASSLK